MWIFNSIYYLNRIKSKAIKYLLLIYINIIVSAVKNLKYQKLKDLGIKLYIINFIIIANL